MNGCLTGPGCFRRVMPSAARLCHAVVTLSDDHDDLLRVVRLWPAPDHLACHMVSLLETAFSSFCNAILTCTHVVDTIGTWLLHVAYCGKYINRHSPCLSPISPGTVSCMTYSPSIEAIYRKTTAFPYEQQAAWHGLTITMQLWWQPYACIERHPAPQGGTYETIECRFIHFSLHLKGRTIYRSGI